MDNFFEILIIFFVIISILNSIFGKKKPQKKESEKQSEIPKDPQQKKDNKEIFEQIFGLSQQSSEGEFKSESEEYKTWDPEDEFKDLTEHKPEEIKDIVYDKLEPIELKKIVSVQTEIKPILPIKTAATNKRLLEIKKKFRDPETLRDYILISEILNKPKAFND